MSKPYELFSFVRLEDEAIERFRLYCESDAGWCGEYGSGGIEGDLRDCYNAYDRATGGGHGIALESFQADPTLENMNWYFRECHAAIDYAYRVRTEKKVGVIVSGDQQKDSTHRLSLSDVLKL